MEIEQNKIFFYHKDDIPYGCFSNFSPHPIWLKSKLWKTSEHYFQAQKFSGTPFEEMIRNSQIPAEAARLGRDRSKPLRKDWETVKLQIMKEAVYAKFTQNKNLKQILLNTGDKILIEHTYKDSYWADGGDGSGQNWLGKILMIVRDHIKNGTKPEETEEKKQNPIEEVEEEKIVDLNTQEDKSSVNKVSPTQKSYKRAKAQRKRNIFLDADGSSKIEKNIARGEVNVVGLSKDNELVFPESALTSSAKFVVHKNQYKKKKQANEEDFEDMEDNNETEMESEPRSRIMLSDFFPGTKINEESETPDYLISPQQCIKSVQSTLELLNQLPNDDPSIPNLLTRCQILKEALIGFISQTQNEEILMKLITQLEILEKI